jgi:hypothetical protein
MQPVKAGSKRQRASSGSGEGVTGHGRIHSDRSKHTSERFARCLGNRWDSDGERRASRPGVIFAVKSAVETVLDSRGCQAAEASSLSGATSESRGRQEKGTMMRQLCGIGDFVRRLRVQARFGELSRAPLRLLRLQVCGDTAECDWMARAADAWDAALPRSVRERNASAQALKDAIAVRDLLFGAMPDLTAAAFRVYRQSAENKVELIITGSVSKQERAPAVVRSLAMRAKLFGLQFWLDEGVLETLLPEELAVNS